MLSVALFSLRRGPDGFTVAQAQVFHCIVYILYALVENEGKLFFFFLNLLNILLPEKKKSVFTKEE